jgi:hypothetical protein
MAERNNTPFIVGMALASGAGGAVPVPWFGSYLLTTSRRIMVRVLARRLEVEMTPGVLDLIVGHTGPDTGQLVISAARRLAAREMVALARTVPLLFRAGDVMRTFVLGRYFEYYCQNLHQKPQVDADLARKIGLAVNEAADSAVYGVFGSLVRYAMGEAVGLAIAVPRALFDLLKSAIRDNAESSERVIEQDTAGLFGKAARVVENQIDGMGRAASDGFYLAFENAWAGLQPAPA